MKRFLLPILSFCLMAQFASMLVSLAAPKTVAAAKPLQLFEADNSKFQYMGRVDFSKPKLPKFWAPGVTIRAKFKGPVCEAVFNDVQQSGDSHNFIEIAVDDQTPYRVQTTGPINTFRVEGLSKGGHLITLCKDTEASMGPIEFVGLRCQKLLSPPPLPKLKMEFFGDSITCGASSDLSKVACKAGAWYDQHNAYMAYGPSTARLLNAQWQLTSVSGIRLTNIGDSRASMPEIFDTMNHRKNGLKWDFRRYQPDAVVVCLGQNDGPTNPELFRDTYLKFIASLRQVYPNAQIVCMSSPMADANLRAFLRENLTKVVEGAHQMGDGKVSSFFFTRAYNGGCGGHPSVKEHLIIAEQLAVHFQAALHWT